MSVGGMHEMISGMRPRGLKTALRYARASRGTTVAELDCLMFATARAWIAEVGIAQVPRTDGWAALSAWATKQLGGNAPELLIIGGETRQPEPELPDSVELEEELHEIEVEWEL